MTVAIPGKFVGGGNRNKGKVWNDGHVGSTTNRVDP